MTGPVPSVPIHGLSELPKEQGNDKAGWAPALHYIIILCPFFLIQPDKSRAAQSESQPPDRSNRRPPLSDDSEGHAQEGHTVVSGPAAAGWQQIGCAYHAVMQQ